LDGWLDRFQDTYRKDVTIVIDCCHAASLLDELAYPGTNGAKRIVMASAGTNEPAYFVAGGLVSFSDAFFAGILMGRSVAEAYQMGSRSMSAYQHTAYYDSGNGSLGADLYLGPTYLAGKDVPQIELICESQRIDSGTAALLWARVTSVYRIDRVWCLVFPPGYAVTDPSAPVTEISEVELAYNPAPARYDGVHEGFTERSGPYKVIYYAQDEWGSVSAPRVGYVTQDTFDERAVLVAAGETTDAHWGAVSNLASLAYHTFRARKIESSAIWCLSAATNQDLDADGTNDVRGLPSMERLHFAVTQWAGTTNWGGPADKLTVYLIGDGTNGMLRLNSTQSLDAITLDSYVDEYQVSNRQACVVMEFAGSGAFLPQLTAFPTQDQRRVCIASTREGQAACLGDGLTSFSQYFLNGVFMGWDVYKAYRQARTAIRKASGTARQQAQLDDNGDGVSGKSDGALARQTYIGAAFLTGAEAPTIAGVTPSAVLTESNTVTLWASGVTAGDGVSNVWCAITAPGQAATNVLPQTNLAWSAQSQRYETAYTSATLPGTYVFTFYAKDKAGKVSVPAQTEILRPDGYEQDDSAGDFWGYAEGETQSHNLHRSGDEDWVRFFAVSNWQYQIETEHWGTNVDTALEVYRQLEDGTLSNLTTVAVDAWGTGEDGGEMTWLDYPGAGIYWVRVASGDTNAWGVGSEYDVRVWVPVGADGTLWVAVQDAVYGVPPAGAYAVVDGITTQYVDAATGGTIFSGLTPGQHGVTVPALAGYVAAENAAAAGAVTNAGDVLYGNPRSKGIPGDGYPGCAFAFYPMARVQGMVRDGLTGARVSGAKIAYKVRGGAAKLYGTNYWRYQNVQWTNAWASDADGTLPNDRGAEGLLAPAVLGDLIVSNAGYRLLIVSNALPGKSVAGGVSNLGVLVLGPVDANGNGVADDWEQKHFPGGMGNKTNDTDHDGSSDGDEYGAGTDPTNAASVLGFDGSVSNLTGGFRVQWDSVPWRTYHVRGTNTLMGGSLWPILSPDMEATQTQYRMAWLDAGATSKVQRFYRVDVVLP
jgi:hypothetical protein